MPTPGSPESAMAAFNDGLAAFEAGSYADALECFDKSLYLHPDASPQALESRLAWKEKSSAHAREQEVSSLASIPSLLPPLPTGERLTIATGSLANCDTGGHLWSSAPALCRWLKSEAEMVAGKTVIELGCGTGAVGIYAAGLAARQVVLTDGGPPDLLSLAHTNVAGNRKLYQQMTTIDARPLVWGPTAASHSNLDLLDLRFNLILASDVTYWIGAHADLCFTLHQLLSLSPQGLAVIAHEQRAVPDDRLERFREEAQDKGLSVDTLHTDLDGERTCIILEVALRRQTP